MDHLFGGVYHGKTVLITGHTGFKGAWLALWLHLLGARVIGYALPPITEPSLFRLANLQEGLTHVAGDIRDADKVREVWKQYQPQIVFHLAAQSLVRYSYKQPLETYATNVLGTVNVLEATRLTPSVRACVNVTSDKCYENREWPYAYRENDAMGGFDPYSSSKGCAELITAAYRNSFFLNGDTHPVRLASARAGNVIGGGDWAEDRLIPDAVRALTGGQAVVVRNPHAIRPWQYVLEPLAGYLWLGACLWSKPSGFDEAWNFGPHCTSNLPVSQIVNQVVTIWGKGTWTHTSGAPHGEPHEARTLSLDITKAKIRLGWEPVFSVDQAIAETVNWYREQYSSPELDVRTFSSECIARYVQAAMRNDAVWTAKQENLS
ncbi:MAG: CDP-glucose 4,6-dehydratase [Nitrospirales bacterium]